MTKKIKKWFKSVVDEVIFMYIVGIIVGIIAEKIKFKYFTKFTYHGGETLQVKDGDYMAWDDEIKKWAMHRPTNKD